MHIEWVFIPTTFDDPHEVKYRSLPKLNIDIVSIIKHLKKYANFPIVKYNDGIKIIGYEW